MSILDILGLSHIYGERPLYTQAEFSLYKGEHVGIVGPNGAGKSTLIRICSGEVIPDSGQVRWQPGVSVGCMDQHGETPRELSIAGFLKSAFVKLYQLEARMEELYSKCAENPELMEQAYACQEELEAKDFYSIDLRVEKVAAGLGLKELGMEKLLGELSGGQRAKAILAKLLLQEPEVLLLDEPTNFLDKEHVLWLGEFLAASEKAFLVVSHNFEFLQKISTHICNVENGSIRKYAGSYKEFLKQKQHYEEDYLRRYTSQRREIERTEAYIRKNIAGVNTRIAKGRRKQLSHIERMAPPQSSQITPKFVFKESGAGAENPVEVKKLLIGYDHALLPAMDFKLNAGERVVITGFNGVGKTTLLKTIIGELKPLGGRVHLSKTACIAYYGQELMWSDGENTPLQIMQEEFPNTVSKELRKWLSHCGVSREHAMQPIQSLSGGEQAKVKLGILNQRPCNLLVLDEPTNHLDAVAKEALQKAILNFSGTLLLVSHEEAFYKQWADRVLAIGE